MRALLKISILVFFVLNISEAFCTHLVGGFISYRKSGQSASGARYIIKITSYRDCKSGSVEFEDEIDVCIYNRQNNRLFRTETFDRGNLERVKPLGRTDCPGAANVCLEKTTYEKTVTLPNSPFGYIIQWKTCCRNTQVNLKDDVSTGDPFIGQTYQVEIPQTNIDNSSPEFTDVPVPFICVNDTTELNNYAIDPDGDSLVYKLATPWYGSAIGTSGCSTNYEAPVPISNGDYKSGFNGNIPFGSSGISLINSKNGITTFLARQVGNYAVAIDLLEFRNGVQIGRTRLDLQILVINCTPNNKPRITNTTRRFGIIAGETLCFNVTGTDADANQNLTLTGIGNLLNGANGFKGTRATFSSVTGRRNVSSQFCWKTDCDQFSNDSQLFTVQLIDDGCPSKFTYVNFSILVKPFTGKVSINGPTNVCQGSKDNIYTITPRANTSPELIGITYNVTVTNGTLKNKAGNLLTIDWANNVSTGIIEVTPVSQYGCLGEKFIYNVPLRQAPPPPSLLSIDTVCEFTSKNYSTTLTNGYTYDWWVNNGTINGSSKTNNVNITWGTTGSAWAKLVQYNTFNCPSDTATINVWISKPSLPVIKGNTSVCPNNNGIEYSVTNTIGSFYFWQVIGGTIASGQNTNAITINWGNEGLGMVKVIEINKFGCSSDTGKINVNKTYALTAAKIEGDTSICAFSSNIVYTVPFTKNSTYQWSITGGTIIAGNLSNTVIVNWGASATGSISMYERSYDSINNRICISGLSTRIVNIRPYPTATIINGDFEVCQLTGIGTYSVNGLPNSKYAWFINNDSTNIIGQGSNTIRFPYTNFGSFLIKVTEISEFDCIGNPIDSILIIHPKPRTTPILGDTIVCYPNFTNYNYTTTGFVNSTYQWFLDGGSPINNSIIPQITINWNGKQNSEIKVLETSEFGCVGDTIKQKIFIDQPSLYLNYITVNPPPTQDNGIDLYWRLINAPRYNNQLFIERREAGTSTPFDNVGTVSGSTVQFNNGNISTDFNAWEYRVKGFDLCGQEILTNLHTNIYLTGKKVNGYEVALDFTPYIGWGNSNIQYDVYRQLKNKTDYELYESNVTSFKAYYNNGLEHYTQCYRIKGTKIGTDTVTWSNDVCFNFDPIIFIPNAFSPDNDEFNNFFIMKGGALKTVEIMVYNRWGEKLWTGFDINAKWDGKYKGKDQPQDVYMYYCKYSGFDGRKYSTKGTITLLR